MTEKKARAETNIVYKVLLLGFITGSLVVSVFLYDNAVAKSQEHEQQVSELKEAIVSLLKKVEVADFIVVNNHMTVVTKADGRNLCFLGFDLNTQTMNEQFTITNLKNGSFDHFSECYPLERLTTQINKVYSLNHVQYVDLMRKYGLRYQ